MKNSLISQILSILITIFSCIFVIYISNIHINFESLLLSKSNINKNYRFYNDIKDKENIVFIPYNSSLKKIANILYNQKLLKSKSLKDESFKGKSFKNRSFKAKFEKYKFLLFSYLYSKKYILRSGEYYLGQVNSLLDILYILSFEENVKYKFTIKEGEILSNILKNIKNNEKLKGKIRDNFTEGSLMPLTYFYKLNDDRNTLLLKMQKEMDRYLEKILPQLDNQSLPIKTKKQLLTLASIIEKESSDYEDKRKISAIYLNRLRKNMKLQADPTLIYALTKGKYKLNRKITKADLTYDSPYNTYIYKNLPIGPISMPSKTSIMAIVNPAKIDALYFVANGKGQHHIANNFKDHMINIKKYKSYLQNKDFLK